MGKELEAAMWGGLPITSRLHCNSPLEPGALAAKEGFVQLPTTARVCWEDGARVCSENSVLMPRELFDSLLRKQEHKGDSPISGTIFQ